MKCAIRAVVLLSTSLYYLSAQCLLPPIQSTHQSQWYQGLLSVRPPHHTRLLAVTRPDSVSLPLQARMVFLDTFGNADFSADSTAVRLQFQALSPHAEQLTIKATATRSCDQRPIDLILCIEYTEATFPFFSPLGIALRSTLPLLPADSRITILFYNHSIFATELQTPIDRISLMNFAISPPSSNIVALLRTLYHALSLTSSPLTRKVIIAVGRGVDNGSLTLSLADVLRAAKQLDVPIYSVLLGDIENTALSTHLCSSSGTPLYLSSSASSTELQGIFREIILGLQHFYTVTIQPALYRAWDSAYGEYRVVVSLPSQPSSNAILLSRSAHSYVIAHQIVATFATGQSQLQPSFYEQLDRVVELLQLNPDQSILLVGHSSIDGSAQRNQHLSYQRAIAVKRYLVRKGIAAHRIRCIGRGSSEPIYPFALTPWQKRLNQRVEIRWLSPVLLPYEIYAEQTESESEAQQKARQWEQRGFHTYIKPLLERDRTLFQVVLWGFESRAHAEATRDLLQQRYNISLRVSP